MEPNVVRALAFDVFGTVVDWRSSLIAMCGDFGRERGIDADWPALVDAWRAAYRPSMDRVRRGEQPWANLDRLHRTSLVQLLDAHRIRGVSADDVDRMVRMWHRLAPWPDAVRGLRRLRERFVLATLSNGNVSLLVDMAKAAGLPWDCVLSAEMCAHYKPDPDVYALAIRYLADGQPERVMMVAAHNDDLRHARAAGMRTAFIARPTEYGPAQTTDLRAEPFVDVTAGSIEDLADSLLAP